MTDEKKYGMEAALAAMERSNKHMFIIILVLIAALIVSWAGFIWYESQFETVEQTRTVEQQADGDGNYQLVGGDYYGGQPDGAERLPDRQTDAGRNHNRLTGGADKCTAFTILKRR